MREMSDDVFLRHVIARFLYLGQFDALFFPHLFGCLEVCIALIENLYTKEQRFLFLNDNSDIVYTEQIQMGKV